MKYFRRLSFVVFCLVVFFLASPANGQTYHFVTYGIENGLSNKFIYTINEDTKGFLWLGTGTELMRFDGKTFKKGFLPDSMQQSFVTSSLKDSLGNLWFGFNDGYVGCYRNGTFKFYDIHRFSKSRIYGLARDPIGNILVASQNGGIYRIIPGDDKPYPLSLKEVHQISSVAVSGDWLLIGTFDGLYIYRFSGENESPSFVKKEAEITSRVQTIFPDGQEIWAGTIDDGVYRLTIRGASTGGAQKIEELGDMNITDILRDSKGGLLD